MTSTATDDAASEVFTEVAASTFEVESLYDNGSVVPEEVGCDVPRSAALEVEEDGREHVTAAQAAKAIEAAVEHGPAPCETSEIGREEVALDAGPAPPNYAAATAGRSSPVSTGTEITRHDHPDQRYDIQVPETELSATVDVERQLGFQIARGAAAVELPVHPRFESEKRAFGGPWATPGFVGSAPRWSPPFYLMLDAGKNFLRNLFSRRTSKWMRQNLLYFCLGQAALTFAVLYLVTSLRPRYQSYEVFPQYFPQHPRRRPASEFHKWYHPASGGFWTHYNDFTTLRVEDIGNFSFVEDLNLSLPANFTVAGTVDVLPAPLAQTIPIEVWTNIATNQEQEVSLKLIIQKDGNALHLQQLEHMHELIEQHDPSRGMLSLHVWVGIYVNIEMENFHLSTNTFDLSAGEAVFLPRTDLLELWKLKVKRELHLSTVSGDIDASAYWDAPHIFVQSGRGHIGGRFHLRDSLTISGGSKIEPRIWQLPRWISANPNPTVEPSILRISTSGNIDFQFQGIDGDEDELPSSKDTAMPDRRVRPGSGDRYLLDALLSSPSGNITFTLGSKERFDWEGTMEGFAGLGAMYSEVFFWSSKLVPNVEPAPVGEYLRVKIGESNSKIKFNASAGAVGFDANEVVLNRPEPSAVVAGYATVVSNSWAK